jgi:hypothetical protein
MTKDIKEQLAGVKCTGGCTGAGTSRGLCGIRNCKSRVVNNLRVLVSRVRPKEPNEPELLRLLG